MSAIYLNAVSCYTHKTAIVSWPQTLWRHFALCIFKHNAVINELRQNEIIYIFNMLECRKQTTSRLQQLTVDDRN